MFTIEIRKLTELHSPYTRACARARTRTHIYEVIHSKNNTEMILIKR